MTDSLEDMFDADVPADKACQPPPQARRKLSRLHRMNVHKADVTQQRDTTPRKSASHGSTPFTSTVNQLKAAEEQVLSDTSELIRKDSKPSTSPTRDMTAGHAEVQPLQEAADPIAAPSPQKDQSAQAMHANGQQQQQREQEQAAQQQAGTAAEHNGNDKSHIHDDLGMNKDPATAPDSPQHVPATTAPDESSNPEEDELDRYTSFWSTIWCLNGTTFVRVACKACNGYALQRSHIKQLHDLQHLETCT